MLTRLVARALGASLLLTAAIAVVPQPALASCAEPPDLETAFADAEVVFIGNVVELSNQDRTAVMQVEQVWKGPQLPDVVTVNGGPSDPSVITSVDRTFEVGTYIVFPINSDPPFEDNACTLTQRTSTALDVINPFTDEPPEPATTGGTVVTVGGDVGAVAVEPILVTGGTNPTPFVVAGAIVVILGVGVFAWRRRSTHRT
ncbi:MAG: hypothetical protein BMS9Abin20_0648 [Acidimicrobiia bacterium]|nr:MAG: hypothetical protein BMS9Abin20_0648 [Acidimicrobiia bacterium]